MDGREHALDDIRARAEGKRHLHLLGWKEDPEGALDRAFREPPSHQAANCHWCEALAIDHRSLSGLRRRVSDERTDVHSVDGWALRGTARSAAAGVLQVDADFVVGTAAVVVSERPCLGYGKLDAPVPKHLLTRSGGHLSD